MVGAAPLVRPCIISQHAQSIYQVRPGVSENRETFLVTGVLGCLGAWTVRVLQESGAAVVGFDLGTETRRLELVLGPEHRDVPLVRGDITDLAAVERALDEHGVTHVVHLAALQVPFCRENPPLGAAVNVVGTANVFEAVRRRADRIPGIVYASSAAVYGPHDDGAEDELPTPATHYGVYKLANEGTARIYWDEHGLPSVGLRPFTVYGPGRDQGMTSTPTQAMLAAARGEPFHISFGGVTQYQHARDVAECLVATARTLDQGARIHNLPGRPTHMSEVVAAIETAVPEVAGTITFEPQGLPFPASLQSNGAALPYRETPLVEGIAQTVAHFRERAPFTQAPR
jgi:UDP-glucuronate 4-epimerase